MNPKIVRSMEPAPNLDAESGFRVMRDFNVTKLL